jgi:prepilin-type N-terminal cleavage/methylation domain-containing protein
VGQREEITRHARGFTLLEVIVTLFVVALAVGLTVPTIARSSDGIKARAEVARFSAILRHTRERAITGRKAHAVVIDPQAHKMTVHVGGPDGEVRETRALPARLLVEATPPPALTVRFEPQGTSSGGQFRLVSGAITYHVMVDPLTGRVKSDRK